MTIEDPDEAARRLAAVSLAADDPTGWFERLYAAAADGAAVVPWDRGAPHPLLVDWAEGRDLAGSALVVGFGPGFDAEFLAARGATTTAFDVSPSALTAVRGRFPGSPVDYRTADLLAPPPEFRHTFGLVVEIMTVQSMPPPFHPPAMASVAGFVAPGGTLLVVTMVADVPPVDGPPWPLTRAEIDAFGQDGLTPVAVERLEHWWRAEFRRD
ncbi:bifunctional 2-polyprenyl-6-hydroxyphenol methylase/3-demethylubiquinol 3-O-methyltransferase UbiG [Jiangella sp. DSM 45060]|uniref:class I SAM-dependent methyltransferase n=1 Tax=Jiangella sp. DSM 45060 TaxID=1798224 RepID=UPI00087D47E8|nr:class I SAM-dependent methyltransferase [Jiangella sp. DSM 45060]SDT02546.1 Methyltransferase domain-containing protein [Jiangella sp. DSM 45060]